MTPVERRIRELFPTVQITSVSIVVALTLENLLDTVSSSAALWRVDGTSLTLWCHALTVLVVTVKIWSGFAFNAMALDRLPRTMDVLGPLGLLLLVYSLIASIAPGRETIWWCFMAAGSFLAAAYLRTQMPDATSLSSRSQTGPGYAAMIEIALGTAAGTIGAFVWLGDLERATVLLLAAAYLAAQAVSAIGALRVWSYARAVIAAARAEAMDAPLRSEPPPPEADPRDIAAR